MTPENAPEADQLDALAHEIHAAAQRAPGEGIIDAVARISALLTKNPPKTLPKADAVTALNPAQPTELSAMLENEALSDIQAVVEKLGLWAAGHDYYTDKSGYDDLILKHATIADVKRAAKYLHPRLRDASVVLTDYFAAIGPARVAAATEQEPASLNAPPCWHEAERAAAQGNVCGYTPGESKVEIRISPTQPLPAWLELGSAVRLAPQKPSQKPAQSQERPCAK